LVDWQNPATVLGELGAFVKLVHVIDGIYLWEFICNLGFEVSLVRGRRQWRWIAALYIATRLWLIFILFFRYITTSLALSLYGLRCVAIWQRSRIVIAITVAIVIANVIAWVRRISDTEGIWIAELQACMRLHTQVAILNNAVLLGSEVAFLLIMVSGIYIRNTGLRAFNIMYREGLLWLTFAVLMQTVPVVFLVLNFNDPMNGIFIPPAIIFTSIGATRMYRAVSDRHAGNLLDFWETSRDETTGEIRFRRQTQLVGRADAQAGDTASTTALPMGRLVRAQPQPEERYVERFQARDIDLDDDSERDAKRSIVTVDDKQETEWVHAK